MRAQPGSVGRANLPPDKHLGSEQGVYAVKEHIHAVQKTYADISDSDSHNEGDDEDRQAPRVPIASLT